MAVRVIQGVFVKFSDTKNGRRLAPLSSLFEEMGAKDIEIPYIGYKETLDIAFDVRCEVVVECAP